MFYIEEQFECRRQRQFEFSQIKLNPGSPSLRCPVTGRVLNIEKNGTGQTDYSIGFPVRKIFSLVF